MAKSNKSLAMVVGSLALAPFFAAGAYADSMPTTCEGIDNCAEITSTADLSAAITAKKSTAIVMNDFDLTADLYPTSSMDLYLGNYTMTSDGWSLLYKSGDSNIYADENGKIIEVGGVYAPIFVKGGTVTMHSGTIQVGGSSAGVYVGDGGAEAEFIVDGGTIEGTGKHGIYVSDQGKVSLRNGSVSSTRWGINMGKGSEFVMDGGEVNAICPSTHDCIAVTSNGSTDKAGAKVTINDGTITSDDAAIYVPSIDGATIINGGSITGRTGVEIRAGTLDITGGIINATADTYEVVPNGNGTTTIGAAIAISQHTTKKNVNVTVSGGEFTGLKAISERNPQENSAEDLEKVTLSVTGGKFTGDVLSEDLTKFATSGEYSEELDTKYVADDYDLYDRGESGPYFVEPTTTVTLPESVLLEAGETYEITLSDIAKKYGTFAYDSSVVSVNENGVVTAVVAGKDSVVNFNLHNYKTPVDENFKVTVWEVKPDENDEAEDATDSKNIADFFAERIKAALSGDEEFIYNENALLFINDIRNALANGEKMVSGLNTFAVSEEDLKEYGEGYPEIMAALKSDEKAIAFFNSEIDLTNEDGSETFGWGFKLKTPITQRFTIPESYADKEGTFAILRSHLNQSTGKIEVSRLEATRDGDDLLTENDQFSTFVIAYTAPAEKKEDKKDDEKSAGTPETGTFTREGGSATVAALITAIFVGITTSVLSFAYLMSRRNRR